MCTKFVSLVFFSSFFFCFSTHHGLCEAFSKKNPRPQGKVSKSKLSMDWTHPVHTTAVHDIRNRSIPFIALDGVAGTGKTWMAISQALQLCYHGYYERVVFTRPYVGTGKDMGFLSGSLQEKYSPLMETMDYYRKEWEVMTNQKLSPKQLVTIPFYFMRGKTFPQSIVIADEMSNSTPEEMKLLLTRIGTHSKIIMTGDTTQSDLKFPSRNGWEDIFYRRLHYGNPKDVSTFFPWHRFTSKEILRHPSLMDILELYPEESHREKKTYRGAGLGLGVIGDEVIDGRGVKGPTGTVVEKGEGEGVGEDKK